MSDEQLNTIMTKADANLDALKDRCHELYEENERLKETIKHYEDTTTFGDYVKEVNLLIDYKSRCEKAIELIKKAGCYNEDTKSFNDDIWDELDDLLHILQNGSDEE